MLLAWAIRVLINAVALAVTAWLLPGIHFGTGDDNLVTLALVAVIFGVLNAFVKPILALLTCPLYVLTLGLFTFVMNALMLWLTSVISVALGLDFYVDGFVDALLGAIVISLVSFGLSLVIPDEWTG